MKRVQIALFIAVLAQLQGCAILNPSESDQLAYRGTGPNVCMLGGVTAKANEHCAHVLQGVEARLILLNTRLMMAAKGQGSEQDCQTHYLSVMSALADERNLLVSTLYSCPKNSKDCHVSARVQDRYGKTYVLDNGAVLNPAIFPGSVSSVEDFIAEAGSPVSTTPYLLAVWARARDKQ